MDIHLLSPAFWIAALLTGVMGFAIQRGATCTVAAIDELVTRRSARRIVGMVEASLWVVGGLVIAQALGVLPRMPAGYALGGFTLLGGALLGVGAFVNGACVFGAIARLGSGEWAFAVTPLGFYAGCLTVGPLFAPPAPIRAGDAALLLHASTWLALLFAAVMVARVVRPLVAAGAAGDLAQRLRIALASRIWSPHAATTVIGVTFVVILLLVGGTWAYTDVLAELARGMAGSLLARSLLLVALLAGALAGGYTAGRFRSTGVEAAQVAKCFAGGVLMGWGSLLIPGSNDGLILIGMPLLRPYAWVAFLTMCVSIAAAMLLAGRLESIRGRRRLGGN
jgi:toxin CptA